MSDDLIKKGIDGLCKCDDAKAKLFNKAKERDAEDQARWGQLVTDEMMGQADAVQDRGERNGEKLLSFRPSSP